MKKLMTTVAFALLICLSSMAQSNMTQDNLAYARKNITKIDNGTRAFKSLIRSADKEMEREPETVTEKNIVAISGNVHDYVSMGPYWWPDPSKPDGLPYIRKDGERNPELQDLDKDKLARFIRSVKSLSYAYYFSGEKKYAQKAVEFMQVWFLNEKTKMNPNLNFGQMIPGRNDGKGRAEGIIEIYEFIEMLECINLLAEGGAIEKKDLEGVKQWFSDLLDWMLTSEVGLDEKASQNNHGLSYDVQVTAYALFTGRDDVAKEYIANFAADRMYKQIEPDGSQPRELARTLAMHYSIFNINHMLDMATLAKVVGADIYSATSPDGRSISKAIEFIVPYLGKSQNDFPYEQIKEWDVTQERLCWVLRRATYFKKNSSYDKLFDKHCTTKESDLRWLRFTK